MREVEPEKKIEISEADLWSSGRKPREPQASGSNSPGGEGRAEPRKPDLIEMMLERGNMLRALQAVERNQGAAGVDGMEVKRLRGYLQAHWAQIKEQLLQGTYQPRPVRKVKERRVLGLIRRYLESGIMQEGLVEPRSEGTPQGGPLSPLLSNILLDDLDKELEKRGHAFCRYADDCNIYIGSQRAGRRVKETLTRFLLEKLKLKVNPLKSAVDRPWKRKFLGFSLTAQKESRVRVAPQSVKRLEDKLREKFREGRGRNLTTFLEGLRPLLRGWANYFSVAETRGVFEELDQWIRRKLRCMEWRKWKRGRRRMQRLTALGLERERARTSAFNGHGPWWNAGASHMHQALPTAYFRKQGLISLLEEVNWRTALREAASL